MMHNENTNLLSMKNCKKKKKLVKGLKAHFSKQRREKSRYKFQSFIGKEKIMLRKCGLHSKYPHDVELILEQKKIIKSSSKKSPIESVNVNPQFEVSK